MTTSSIPRTLGDTNLLPLRCSHCSEEFAPTAPIEVHETSGSRWIVVRCAKCDYWTPKQWEKEA